MSMPPDVYAPAPVGILNDKQIISRCVTDQMISPFCESMVRTKDDDKILSYGVGSYGYDLRLSPKDFRIFRHQPGMVVNPKEFDEDFLEESRLISDFHGDYFIIPGNSYALGVTVERIKMPRDTTAICLGKSTYARCGVIANITPIEAGWEGHITLEFSNSSPSDVMIFANEGVVQFLFFQGAQCLTSYADRKGKYQDQPAEITLAKV